MTIKRFLLLPGAVALALSFAPMLPLSAQTESTPGKRAGQNACLAQLNLSAEKQQELKNAHAAARAEMQQILGEDFKAEKGRGDRANRREKWRNLPEATRQQLRTAREKHRQTMEAILGSDNLAALKQCRQERKANRQQRQGQNRQNRFQAGQPAS